LPNIKSAQKRVRVAERQRLRNKPVRTLCKSNVTKAERLIFLGDLKAAQEAVGVAVTALDKAAEKGIIHRNNAARRKSRLMKKLNQFEALAPAPVEAKPKAEEVETKVAAAETKAEPKKAAKPKAEKPKAKPKAKAKAKPKATKAEPKKTKETKKKAAPEKLDAEA
jgi:small subunit ribosomal protein S20